MGAIVLNSAGELKGQVFVELIARPTSVEEALGVLQECGVFRGNRYIPRGDLTPGEYALRVLPAAAMLDDGSQWALADLLAWGERFAGVEAIDLETNREADPDLAFENDGAVVPFQYDEVVSTVVTGAPQTLMNKRSVARRFSPERTANPAWAAARWSHYAACAPRDLPDDVVDKWLRAAGRPKAEGGMSVADIEEAIRMYRRDRDARASASPAALAAVPKPSSADAGEHDSRLDPEGAVAIVGAQLAGLITTALSGQIPDDELETLVHQLVMWLYYAAPREVIRAAAEFDQWEE